MDGVHDMGGMHGFGPVVVPEGDAVFHAAWEPRVFAISALVWLHGLGAPPEGRAVRETMDPTQYLEASYYERWLWSTERKLEGAGRIAPGEVETMMERLEAGEMPSTATDPALAARTLRALREGAPRYGVASAPRFSVGDRVRARRARPRGHTRCPRYVRGVAGVVERIQGTDRLPDTATYGLPTEPEPVYAVAFASDDIWGSGDEPSWTVLVDLWETYLEPA
jgi:nitrile hydratase subunit beta